MKKILSLFMLFSTYGTLLHSQNTCATAIQLCSGLTITAETASGSAEAGPDYGCLFSYPNPTWLFLKTATTGTLSVNVSISSGADIDYAVWGPFSAETCGAALGAPLVCDFTGANGGTANLGTVLAGNIYMILVTNYASSVGEISITTSGTATLQCPSPGGVSANGYLWFKSDSRVYSNAGTNDAVNGNTIQEWKNAFPNPSVRKIQQTGAVGLRPTLRGSNHADVLNFNPTIDNTSGTWMKSPATNLTINQIAGSNTNITTYSVLKEAIGGGAQFVIADHPTTSNQPSMIINNDGLFVSGDCLNSITGVFSNTITSNPRMFTTIWGGGSGSSNNFIYDRGVSATLSSNTPVSSFSTLAQNYVGLGYACGTAYPATTKINEVIVYSGNHDATTRNKIESYLALKWGFTLGTTTDAINYTASDGTVYWTADAAYQNNIAGIARDDASDFTQKQSKSVNSGLQVVMGNGNTIAIDNITNTNNFSADKSALVWGDNTGSVVAWTSTGAPTSRQIIARTWKVQETGTVGSVKVQVADNGGTNGLPAETNAVYLLVDADGNFASGATEYAMTLNGTNWEANVNFTSGQYFTFATQQNVPPVLTLAMTSSPASGSTITSGSTVTYSLTVSNTSVGAATTVKVKDQLPGGVTYVSSTPSSGIYDPNTGIWTIPTVATGTPQTLSITVTIQ